MLDELSKALGPWPLLQMFFGVAVLIAGIYAIVRGARGKPESGLEDARAKWEMHRAIGHIHENSFEMVEQLKRSNDLIEQMLAALNRFNDTRWNRRQ